MQQKDNDQFSFINEKIKEKPVNKKRLLMQAGFIALMAVVFGIIASLVLHLSSITVSMKYFCF